MGFKLIQLDGVAVYQSELLTNSETVVHAVSTRQGGVSGGPWHSLNLAAHVGDVVEDVVENRRRFCLGLGIDPNTLVTAKQVHGDRVHLVTIADAGFGAKEYDTALDDTDALITNVPGIGLATFYADCVPLMIIDPVHGAIGMAHAGWKGTVAQIGPKTIQAMHQAFGTEAKDCLVAIGPSIGPCCYEVDLPLIEVLKTKISFADQVLYPNEKGNWQLDLWETNRRLLVAAGVPTTQVEIAQVCTSCYADILFSYRASGGKTGRIGAIMMIKESTK